jgi:hypothetical protein
MMRARNAVFIRGFRDEEICTQKKVPKVKFLLDKHPAKIINNM